MHASTSDSSETPLSATAAQPEPTHDPWVAEAERTAGAEGFRRPSFGPASRGSIYLLGLLAALRAAGLVLIAEAVARGIAALAADGLVSDTTRLIVLFGLAGALLRTGAEWATTVVARRIATRVKADLRATLWRRLAAGDSAGGSAAVLASDGLDDLDDYFQQSVPATIAAAVVPLLITARVLGADWLSALIIVLTVPLIPFFMVLIGKHTQQRTDEALGSLARLADHLTELARGLPVLVGLGRVERQAKALDELQTSYRKRTQETLRWAFLSSLALELTATISVAIVAVFLGLRLLNGTMELEAALLALILAPDAFNALRQVGTAFHASQDGLAALERSQQIIDSEPAHDIRRPADAGIAIRDLTVRYTGRETPALRPVSAELSGIVSIAGPSGAGKSTLLAALTGTLPADAEVAGTITGVEPDAVGWAPQSPRSFTATPRAELGLFGADPLTSLAELGLAHRADAAVAELSPGELRRLAVARALARVDAGARLLVLDEPTAHLDRSAADLVRAAILRRADRAVIALASHEPETTALATQTVSVQGQPLQASAAPAAAPTDEAAAPTAEENPSAGVTDGPRLRLRSLLRPHDLI